MYVYFIQAGDAAIKIGTAESPETRVSGLQTGNHLVLELIGKIRIPEKDAAWPMGVRAKETEAALHALFRESHLRGEWFFVSDRLVNFIARYAEPCGPPSREEREAEVLQLLGREPDGE